MTMTGRPAATSRRYASLDVWRGIACLMVIVDHAAISLHFGHWSEASLLQRAIIWLTGLAWGPSMFFAVSGFCVAASLDSARRKGLTAGAFLGRRAWRILPPYWIALFGLAFLVAVVCAFGGGRLVESGHTLAFDHPSELTASQWVGNATLTETWRERTFGGDASIVYSRVAWTLCYQEQFYAIGALALLIGRGRPLRALAMMAAAILAARVFFYDSGGLQRIQGYFVLYFHEFAAGLLAYAATDPARSRNQRLGLAAALLGLATICGFNGDTSGAVAAGFAWLLVALARFDSQLAGARWAAPLRACGRRSFSIYLTHLPILSISGSALIFAGVHDFWGKFFVVVPVTAALALAFGWWFYAKVETRFAGALPKWSLGSWTLALGNRKVATGGA